MDLATKIERTGFLAYEFLAWLAARSELGLGILADEKDATLEVWLEKRLALTEIDVPAEQTVIRSTEPSTSFETKTALRLGKWIREAHVAVIHNDLEWHFQVSAPDLKVRGVKCKTEFKKDEEGAVIDRVAQLEDLLALWDAFYVRFLELRLDPDLWSAEVARTTSWILQ